MLMRSFVLLVVMMLVQLVLAGSASAQISPSRAAGVPGPKVATLEEVLINRLRATTEDRQHYIRLIVAKVDQGVFDRGRILAIERYAIGKNPQFPFPYFERAMRAEAERAGVHLPPVRLLASSGPARF
jgi:hypothetical protein